MPLPDTKQAGPYVVRREYADNLRNEDGEQIDGELDFDAQLVRIQRGLTPERERVVRLHEQLHHGYSTMGLSERASEETVVTALATYLCMIYPDFEF